MKSKKGPSILAADIVVVGSIMSEGEVQIDGRVEGNVRAGSLDIGPKATVSGEIVAVGEVVVHGRVEGQMRARNVQLASTASVQGEIIHATLAIQSGAFFDGRCRRAPDLGADNKPIAVGSISSEFAPEDEDSALPPSVLLGDDAWLGMDVAPMIEVTESAIDAPANDASSSGNKRKQPVSPSAHVRTSLEPPPPAMSSTPKVTKKP